MIGECDFDFFIVRRESAQLVCMAMRTRAASYAARPQSVNLTLAPTLPFAFFSVFWLALHVYILLFSLIYTGTIPPLSHAILDSRHQSLFPHTSVIFHSNHKAA